MKITKVAWRADRIAHIHTRHQVKPEEVKQACFGHPFILRGKGKKSKCLYQVMGQTHGGRYLFIVVKFIKKETVSVVTARDMDSAERKWYTRR